LEEASRPNSAEREAALRAPVHARSLANCKQCANATGWHLTRPRSAATKALLVKNLWCAGEIPAGVGSNTPRGRVPTSRAHSGAQLSRVADGECTRRAETKRIGSEHAQSACFLLLGWQVPARCGYRISAPNGYVARFSPGWGAFLPNMGWQMRCSSVYFAETLAFLRKAGSIRPEASE